MRATPADPYGVPEGTHPIDHEVEDAGLAGWLVPAAGIFMAQIGICLLFAAGFGVLMMLTPYLSFSEGSRNELLQLLDQAFISLIATLVIATGYVYLARAEGTAHGLGLISPLPERIQRLVAVLAFWLVTTSVFGWFLGEVLGAFFSTSAGIGLAVWAMRSLGWWSLVVAIWLISPLVMILWALSQLSQILAIRTELNWIDIIRTACNVVFGQLGRLVLPTWILFGLLILLLRTLAELPITPVLELFARTGEWLPLLLLSFMTGCVLLPLSFVLERAYVPWAGRTEDASVESLDRPSAPLRRTGNQPATLEQMLAQLQETLSTNGPVAAAQQACEFVRARQRPKADVIALLDVVNDWLALGPALSALTAEFIRNNRAFESIWLTEYGFARDPAFLRDQPDQVVVFAKRLTQNERPDLALKLLLVYVREHHQHSAFLNGALLLARLLMTHGNNPAAAKKLLTHLQPRYPTELQIGQLLKQIG